MIWAAALVLALGAVPALALNTAPPESPVKLIFIHHSTGEGWLADGGGNLGLGLHDNNYFTSDTNYGWGPDGIGDQTDIGLWYNWFAGPDHDRYTSALYGESQQNSSYTRLYDDPGGENRIIMFKSCFPNSELEGSPGDAPTSGDNPMRGEWVGSDSYTVANAKGIYNDLLPYFASRTDKLFILITPPPLVPGSTDAHHAANARAVNDWLVNEWLRDYPHHNVRVFDFFSVLTSNGGDAYASDAGWEQGNHHRIWNGAVQHLTTHQGNTLAYPYDEWDSHPNEVGGQKATAEFIPLLNTWYHCFNGSGACP